MASKSLTNEPRAASEPCRAGPGDGAGGTAVVGLDSDAALTHATSLGVREGELGIPIEDAKAAMEPWPANSGRLANPQKLFVDITQAKKYKQAGIH